MATGDNYVAINTKRMMGFQDFRERLLEYLIKRVTDMHDNAFGDDGVFGGSPITMSLHGAGPDFQLDSDITGTDNDGHFLKTDAELAGRDIGIEFENTATTVYDVALHYAERPRGLQVNPRTGQPEYISWEETVGERDNPDAVVNNGSTLTFTVDSVCNPFDSTKYDFDGRQCLVWKIAPGDTALSESVAVEQCTVTWDSSNNKITTTGLLGQTTPSTTAADYLVLLLGPTVARNSIKDLELEPAYEFIGQVTGGSPPTFDVTKQNDLGAGYAIALNAITRVDSHGDLKVRVSADASDSQEPQISIEDASQATTWKADEKGNQTMLGRLLDVGKDFLDTKLNAALARIVAPYYETSTQTFTLLSEHNIVSGTQQGFRTYAISDSTIGSQMGFAVTINAKWDQASTEWDLDKSSRPAMRAILNTEISGGADSEVLIQGNVDGASFAEGGWTTVAKVKMPQDFGSGSSTLQLWNALIEFTNTTTNGSNPPTTTAMLNKLCAKNTPKAWGVFETDGAGGHTLHNGFNITSLTLSTTTVQVDLASSFDNANWSPDGSSWAKGAAPTIGIPTFEVSSSVLNRMFIRFYNMAGGLLDPTADTFGVSFHVHGEQDN